MLIKTQRTYLIEFTGTPAEFVDIANEFFDRGFASDDVEGATQAFIAHDHEDLKEGVTTYSVSTGIGAVYVSYEDAKSVIV